MPQIWRCMKCNKRLPVDDVEGEIKAVVYCTHCRQPNRLEARRQPRFKEAVEAKS